MKINSIKIENIASLKGSHFIDFDQITRMNNSIFAITGDTGSGKSTILNCISLALYGQTYKKSLNQYDYISLGEAQGSVELSYTQNGKSYCSLWECRVRKQNGEFLKSPKSTRAYFEINKNEKIAIEESPETIIGLDFDQFCQTIILNQGEFARFLSSSFSDRKIILEKLYKADKLKLLNPYVRQKISELSQKLEVLNSKLETFAGSVEIVNEEDLNEKKTSLALINTEHTHSLKAKNLSVDLCKLIQNYETNQERLHLEEENITLIIKNKNELVNLSKEAQDVFEKAKAATNKELPLLYQARELEKQVIQMGKQLLVNKSKEKELASLMSANQNELEAFLQLFEKKEDLIKNIANKYSLDSKQIIENKTLKLLKEQSQDLTSQFNLQSQEFDGVKKRNNELQAKIIDLQEQNQMTQNDLKHSSLENLRMNKEKSESDLKLLNTKISSLESVHKELLELEIKERQERKQESESNEIQKELKEALEEVNENLATIQDALAYNKILEYKTHLIKESLKEGKCLICDNTDIKHIHEDEAHLGTLSKIKTLNEKALRLQKESEDKSKDLLILNEKRNHSKQNLVLLRATLKEKISTLFNNSLNIDSNIKQELEVSFATQEKLMKKIKESESLIQDCVAKKAQEEERFKYLEVLKKDLTHSEEILKNLQFKKNSLMEKANVFLKTFTQETSIKSAKISQAYEALNDLLSLSELQRELSHMHDKVLSLKKSLNTLLQTKQELEEKSKTEEKEIKTLNSQIRKITQGKDIEFSIKELESDLRKKENQTNELKEKLKECEITHSGAKSKINTYTDQFKEIEAAFINTHGNLNEVILSSTLKDEPLYESLKKSFTISKISLDLYLSVTKSLEERLQDLTLNKESIIKFITEKELLIKKALEVKALSESLLNEKEKLIPEKEDWEKLYVLLGRDEFRNFVLSYVEKMLIIQTNHELESLYDGRYSLEQFVKESKTSPEFYIIDRFHGGATRKISTLSGGETFMVSLAMAFALAELTRGESQIDSFFIDEGFGTLDEDSIDDVLNTLQEIEVRGKQIGLISHVKTMTQRIPVNIHLNKNSQGNSQISIVYN